MQRSTAGSRRIRWDIPSQGRPTQSETDRPVPRAEPERSMAANRVSNRVAWDHTVLVNRSAQIAWSPPKRANSATRRQGHPLWIVLGSWALLLWSSIVAWSMWTRSDVDSHISMRFLMRGEIEEISGVLGGAIWAVLPAAAAFYLARRAREVTMDELGRRTYWASLAIAVIAAMGVLRPTWDQAAGSRLQGSAPAAQSAPNAPTQTSSVPAFDHSQHFNGWDAQTELDLANAELNGLDADAARSLADSAPATNPATLAAPSPGARYWASVRALAMARALQVQAGDPAVSEPDLGTFAEVNDDGT